MLCWLTEVNWQEECMVSFSEMEGTRPGWGVPLTLEDRQRSDRATRTREYSMWQKLTSHSSIQMRFILGKGLVDRVLKSSSSIIPTVMVGWGGCGTLELFQSNYNSTSPTNWGEGVCRDKKPNKTTPIPA